MFNDEHSKTNDFTALTEQNVLVTGEAEATQFSISEDMTQFDAVAT